MKKPFIISRDNGKSDAEVIAEIVEKSNPGDLLTYDFLAEVLSAGTNRRYNRQDVQSSINRSANKISSEYCRAFICVRNQGYRIAKAAEHQLIATSKRERASSLIKRGKQVLDNVDWSAMTENERRAHEGQLMIVGALFSAITGVNSRLKRVEDAISARNEKLNGD